MVSRRLYGQLIKSGADDNNNHIPKEKVEWVPNPSSLAALAWKHGPFGYLPFFSKHFSSLTQNTQKYKQLKNLLTHKCKLEKTRTITLSNIIKNKPKKEL